MTDNAPTRLAVVGAGPIGQRHLQAISAATNCQAVAVVDPAPLGKSTANNWQTPHYADMAAMFDDVSPDGVINATPNALHLPLSLECIERGIPVLVEKPIADTLASAYALTEASEAAGVPVLVGHHRRHNPIVAKAREVVQSGTLGRLTAISATWLAHKPDDYFETSWRTEPGGGPILINLIHDIDSLRFIAGEITSVQGMTSSAGRGFEVEDTAALMLRFASGALATVILSDTAAAPWSWELTANEKTSYTYPHTGQDCYLLAGSEASLAVPSLQLWRHDGARSWQTPMVSGQIAVKQADPLQRQISHFADVIHGRATPLITARDATKTLEVCLAVSEAAAESREIQLKTD